MTVPRAFLLPKSPAPVIAATRSKLARPTRPQLRPPMTSSRVAMLSSCFMSGDSLWLELHPETGGDRPDPGVVGKDFGLVREGDVALGREHEGKRAVDVVGHLGAGVDGRVREALRTRHIEGDGA